MKTFILGLEKGWMAALFAIMGVLLILFPAVFTVAVPYMIGIGLIATGIFSIIALIKYKSEAKVKPGKIVIVLVLGCATLAQRATAIGPIGAIWAMISLYEVSEEITEDYQNKHISVVRIIAVIVSIALAVMLLFNPFDHFTVHVRILGLEMLAYVFIRKRNLMKS